MNREIKFRAWNVVTKTMIDLKKMTPLALNMDTDGLFIPFSDGLPIMQFTGLKDSKGVDIYEGDIFGKPDQLRCIVEREPDGAYVLFFIHPLMKNRKISILDHKVSKSPIIGNIYQHPELLNQNQR
jgi:hypothetical protein